MLGEDPDPFGEGLLSDDVFVRCIICRPTLQEKKNIYWCPKTSENYKKPPRSFNFLSFNW
jgi:hypothetical protein